MKEQASKQPVHQGGIWQIPWKYKESFIISAGLVLFGFIIELITGGKGVGLPAWPANFFFILLFIVYVILFHRLVTHPIKRWFSSVPAAIASISTLTFLVLLMGFIPQGADRDGMIVNRLGLNHLATSWPYLLCSLNLVFVLSFTIIRKILPFSLKSAAFTLNHMGLWVVLVAASLGSTDTQKLHMQLEEGKVIYTAKDEQNRPWELDFALKLEKFRMEEFTPKIGLIDPRLGGLKKTGDNLPEVKTGMQCKLGDWDVKVDEFIENALRDSAGYIATQMTGSAPAVFITARNSRTRQTTTGWVSSGSFMVNSEILMLTEDQAIAMTTPQSKKFSSDITAYHDMNKTDEMHIEVNQPGYLKGWTIYQSGYDEEMGKWSTSSTVELVHDPWLPVVYVGIFMILAGSLYLVWMGRSKF